ncbi:MAG: HAD family hydrolase [Phycisphaerae bacterium]|nr:HAD family hydrolase [Phycisphaerae bacterium]
MATRVVIFDLDDTLIADEASADAAILATCEMAREKHGVDPKELHPTVRRMAREVWYASPARAYCVAVGISSWEGLWMPFYSDDPDVRQLREWVPTYRKEAWSRSLAEHGVDDVTLALEMAAAFQRERPAHHIVYADSEPTLRSLRRTYRLGLLTNGAVDLQRDKIKLSGLGPFFDVVTISGEIGIGKPDPQVFALSLDRMSAEPAEAVMVGNSLKSDIAGAQGAGIRAIWLNRSGETPEDGIEPDAEIAGLDELEGIL